MLALGVPCVVTTSQVGSVVDGRCVQAWVANMGLEPAEMAWVAGGEVGSDVLGGEGAGLWTAFR